ncbi:MAG: inositol monophosphatase [Bdellovibrionales bacterium]|nr:inositol monophosphatase [Bdellovibrionales bacterium]
MSLDLKNMMMTAQRAVIESRALLLDYFGKLKRVDQKVRAGLVSEADIESEKLITKILSAEFPNHKILGEEASYAKGKIEKPKSDQPLWVIDPLDGTTNYVHGFSIFCISIGLWYKEEAVLGVIDAPALDATYTAIKGQGAFKNGLPISVSSRSNLKDSLLATGFYTEDLPSLTEQIRVFSNLMSKTRGIRRAGAAAYDLCMVAEGIFDAFWEKSLSPWDVAAGGVIVKEAGGRVTDYQGAKFNIFDNNVLATNKHLHQTLVKEIGLK